VSVALTVLCHFNAIAEEDTYRVNLSTISMITTDSSDTTTRSPVAGLQVFFKPVTIDPDQAFDQHEFIQRASNLYLTLSPVEGGTSTMDTRLSRTGVSVSYYQDDFFATIGFAKGSGESIYKASPSLQYDLQYQSSSFSAGYYLFPLSQLLVGVDKSRLSFSANSLLLPTLADDVTTKTSLTSKTLWNIDTQQSLCFELSLSSIRHEDSDTLQNNEADASLKYYPVPSAYAQLELIRNQGDYKTITGDTSVLAAGYAFTPRLSLYAAYLNFKANGTAQDNHSVLVAGNYRF